MRDYKAGVRKRDPEVALVRKVLRERDIRYRFHWTRKCNHATGKAFPRENQIRVWVYKANNLVETESGYDRYTRKRLSLQEFLSVVFHEVAHILCVREGSFLDYLNADGLETQEQFDRWSEQALPAELEADRRGAAMMKVWFPEIPFLPAYKGYAGERYVRHRVSTVAKERGFKV